MLGIFNKHQKVHETPFSKFIRDASSADKKRVYVEVLRKATDRQIKVIEQAKSDHGLRTQVVTK